MKLLRELTRLQHERGYVDDESLRELAVQLNVPLSRLEGLVSFYTSFRRKPPPQSTIQVCQDVTCMMAGAASASQSLLDQWSEQLDLKIEEVSCLGRCDAAPAATVNETPIAPRTLENPDHLARFVESPSSPAVVGGTGSSRTWRSDPYAGPGEHYHTARKLVSEQNDVASVCLQRLKESRLRGMGGAGFPTGRKWELVANETESPKYVICNADESEPGTFKDRLLLAELPHLVIEGMLLAGLTIGSETGIIYLRHEYGPEKKRIEAALLDARAKGMLGKNVARSDQSFDIQLFESPGGYILGEETALLEALEDKRGEPRNKPPYPGNRGLWGKPTLINNVETLALAVPIIHHGPAWWDAQGLGDYSGLKFISISGDVEKPGVHEIPVGTTVAQAIELAGGMKDQSRLKAFLPGGASSNFLPASHATTAIDFDSMNQAGSMLGTGAIIVMSDRRDLFAIATNLVRFFRNESCGKCVPCRTGSEYAVRLLEGIRSGRHTPSEVQVLDDLADTLKQTSICGLGQVALNPVLSMLKHFPGEIPVNTANDE
ncbi:MAG: nitroreductase family protein [Planctomycetaceae bacterium]|nr:nitroreductase family protein [Planctomycetaceae bacterium]MBP62255.1 nitroreductase family protein [Planctomycetaceae bacterium]